MFLEPEEKISAGPPFEDTGQLKQEDDETIVFSKSFEEGRGEDNDDVRCRISKEI